MSEERLYDTKPIEEALAELDYTNERAAVYADVSSTTLTRVRKADDGVRVRTLLKVARALNLQVEIRFTRKTGHRAPVAAR